MKPGRQSVILDIITHQNIETQRQLQEALLERGVKSTQATLSRDIKDMRRVKELGPDGNDHYAVSGRSEEDDARHEQRKRLAVDGVGRRQPANRSEPSGGEQHREREERPAHRALRLRLGQASADAPHLRLGMEHPVHERLDDSERT